MKRARRLRCTARKPAGERLVDLNAPLTEDVALELLKESDEAALKVVRHSAAHVMATAILELFPETKLGHGPATDAGFFYDVYRETPFSDEDLAAIEKRMAEVVARDEKFVRVEEPREKGLTDYAAQGEFMKVHFIERFTKPGDEISLYRNGNFTRLLPRAACAFDRTGEGVQGDVGRRAPTGWATRRTSSCSASTGRRSSTRRIWTRTSSGWRRSRRATIACWASSSTCSRSRRWRASGLIFWHPKGGLIRKTMEDWMREECIRRGYEMVYTPHIMRRELWKICGP